MAFELALALEFESRRSLYFVEIGTGCRFAPFEFEFATAQELQSAQTVVYLASRQEAF